MLVAVLTQDYELTPVSMMAHLVEGQLPVMFPTCVDGDCSHCCATQIQTRLPTQRLQSYIARTGECRNTCNKAAFPIEYGRV